MTNKEIIEKYLNNENARNNNLMSLDNKLYSYDLLISEIKDHKKFIFDYDINTIKQITGYKSLTTRKHIGVLKEALKNDLLSVIVSFKHYKRTDKEIKDLRSLTIKGTNHYQIQTTK
tara:strand:+ start:8610 stop:8960 length:351 start_codon:yes stop_codon:yes gene_type:complete